VTTPSDARTAVLARIRASIGVTGKEPLRRAAVADRLAGRPRGVIPETARVEGAARLAAFAEKVVTTMASFEAVATAAEVPMAVAAYLAGRNLPAEIRHGADPRLASLPWSGTMLAVSTGRSDGRDPVGVSHAEAGIAETGSVVLVSGPDNPTTLNFLPETHVVVVDAADIVGGLEDAMARIRARFGAGVMPRTVNFVTGPSRSADIEQKLLYGAHGPKRLHVIMVGVGDGGG